MKKQPLSPERAFAAMSIFLDKYYARTAGSGDLGALLGDLQVNERDGLAFDPAVWADWLAAIDEALGERDRKEQLVIARR
jgi:hypothetical protein